MRLLLCLGVLAQIAAGQQLSLGVIGGFSATDAFQNRTATFGPGGSFRSNHAYSQSKDWMGGAAFEVRFGEWSLEADAIFRQLHLTQEKIQSDGRPFGAEKTPVVTWEIPVLAKYRLPTQGIRPFFEGGPTYRTTGNKNGTNPSHFGVTAGAGVEMQWRHFRIAPTVRYTRWGRDNTRFDPTLSAPHQVEFLVGISTDSGTGWQPLGSRVSLGVIMGTNLTADVATESRITVQGASTLVSTEGPGPRNLAIGPYAEVPLPWNLSVEVDAVHRHIAIRRVVTVLGPRPPGLPPTCCDSVQNANIWEFPVLFKKSFGRGTVRPFVGLGPTFRRPQGLTTPSPYGVVTTAGAQVKWRRLRLSPSLRFMRWGEERLGGGSPVRRNQTQFLMAFGF